MTSSPISETRFRWVFLTWWTVWAILHGWILYSLEYSLTLSSTDSTISNSLLAGTCWLAGIILQYYQPVRLRYLYMLALSLILSIACIFLVYYILEQVIVPEKDYSLFLYRSLPVRFSLGFLMVLCMAMMSVLWYSVGEQKELAKRQSDMEKMAREAELFKLRTQLQPHFLFNSLNSINALIGSQPQEARKMIQQLSDFLRTTLKRDEQQWVTVEDEMKQLELYLDIEKVRFGNRLSAVITTDPDLSQSKLPAMLLQPLLENAIKFGLYDTTGQTEIRLDASREDRMLVIKIQNPFDPETASPRRGTGFGLNSVRRRLYLLFARNDLLFTQSDNHIFTTTLKIPQP